MFPSQQSPSRSPTQSTGVPDLTTVNRLSTASFVATPTPDRCVPASQPLHHTPFGGSPFGLTDFGPKATYRSIEQPKWSSPGNAHEQLKLLSSDNGELLRRMPPLSTAMDSAPPPPSFFPAKSLPFSVGAAVSGKPSLSTPSGFGSVGLPLSLDMSMPSFAKPQAPTAPLSFDNTLRIFGYDRAPDLPEQSGLWRLEPTSFSLAATRGSDVDIAKALSSCFKGLDCDYRFDSSKFKFTCQAFQGGQQLMFRAYIWAKDDGFVVELNRRRGCCIQFRKIFDAAKRKATLAVQGSHTVLDSLPSPIVPTPPSPPVEEAAIDDDDETPQSLQKMLQSEHGSVVLLALSTIAQLSSPAVSGSADAVVRLLSYGLVPALVSALLSPCREEGAVCAATAIANLLEQNKEAATQLSDPGIKALLSSVKKSPNIKMVRESARALCHLSESRPAMVSHKFRTPVARLMTVADLATRDYGQRICRVAERQGVTMTRNFSAYSCA